MKRIISISVIIAILLLIMAPLQVIASNASGCDMSRYIGEYYLPSEETRANFGVQLNIYEITDDYISFDYQRPAAGHAVYFTAEPAYFENAYTARGNGTVAYADQRDQAAAISFVLTLSYNHITVECIRDGQSIAADDFYLTRNMGFSRSNYNIIEQKHDLCFDDYYIIVRGKTLSVVDLRTYENTVISDNASWNFMSDGNYLYYVEYTSSTGNSLEYVNLDTLETQYLFSAEDLFLVDCDAGQHILYEYYTNDDAEDVHLGVYDVSSNRYIDEYVFGAGISENRVIYSGHTGDYAPVALYSSNLDGSGKIEISDKMLCCGVEGNYIYYAEATEGSIEPPFVVKRCDLFGGNTVSLTSSVGNKIVSEVNAEYVECLNFQSGSESRERIYYNYDSGGSVVTPDEAKISVLINGSALSFDQPPIMINDRMLVPVRAIFEALGMTVYWDDASQTATAVKDGITITVTIGDYAVYRNGERIEIDVPAMLVNDRTLVPARAVSESAGAVVDWQDDTNTVNITYTESANNSYVYNNKQDYYKTQYPEYYNAMYKAVECGYIRPYGPGTHWAYYPNYGKTFMDNEVKYSDGFADYVFSQDLWQDFEVPKYETIVKYICENYYEYSIVYKKSVLKQVLKLKFDIEIDDLINHGITSQVYMDDNYIAFKAFGVGETYPETLTIVDSIEMINDNYAYCIWHRVDEKNINERSDTIYGILEKGMVEGTSVVGYRYLSLTPPSDDIIGLYKNPLSL